MVLEILLPAALLALGEPRPLASEALFVPFALAGAPHGEGYTPVVTRVVQSLIEYTHWPRSQNPLRLCVAGPALYVGRLDGLRLMDGRTIDRRNLPITAIRAAVCDAVYIGQLPLPAQRQLTNALRGRGVMTIAEADPQCRSQAMFCLNFAARGVSFRLNVGAVARSALRVDPRILRLAAGHP